MRLYILVEGKETEMKFYPALINFFHPEYSKVDELSEMTDNSFYILSGLGMPSTFKRITSCLNDICKYNNNTDKKINVFVVVFDQDRYPSMSSAVQAIQDRFNITENSELITKSGINKFYIIQNPCIETWFLGNKKIINEPLRTAELRQLIQTYDIRTLDPENLSLDEKSDADAAKYYLDCIFRENGEKIGYHKSQSIKKIASSDYICEINNRFKEGHISSFHYVVDLMNIL